MGKVSNHCRWGRGAIGTLINVLDSVRKLEKVLDEPYSYIILLYSPKANMLGDVQKMN